MIARQEDKERFRLAFPMLCLLAISVSVFARVVNVPGDFLSITEAISNSTANDTILVGAGRYEEQLLFPLHRLTVTSHFPSSGDSADLDSTILDASPFADADTACAIVFRGSADSSMLSGFTITGGHGYRADGTCGSAEPSMSRIAAP